MILVWTLAVQRVVVGNDNGWFRHLLDYRLADNVAIDALRYITIACAAFIVVWCFKKYQHKAPIVEQLRWTFFLLFGVFVFLQEADQVGQPFLVWRSPTLLTLCVLGIVIQWLRERIRERR